MAQRRPTGRTLGDDMLSGNLGLDISSFLGRSVRLRNRWQRKPLGAAAGSARLLGGRIRTERATRPVTGVEATEPD